VARCCGEKTISPAKKLFASTAEKKKLSTLSGIKIICIFVVLKEMSAVICGKAITALKICII